MSGATSRSRRTSTWRDSSGSRASSSSTRLHRRHLRPAAARHVGQGGALHRQGRDEGEFHPDRPVQHQLTPRRLPHRGLDPRLLAVQVEAGEEDAARHHGQADHRRQHPGPAAAPAAGGGLGQRFGEGGLARHAALTLRDRGEVAGLRRLRRLEAEEVEGLLHMRRQRRRQLPACRPPDAAGAATGHAGATGWTARPCGRRCRHTCRRPGSACPAPRRSGRAAGGCGRYRASAPARRRAAWRRPACGIR